MSQDNLLHDSQAEAGPFFVGRDVRFENFQALAGRYSRSIVPNFQGTFGSASSAANDLDFTARIHGLSGIQQKVEEELSRRLILRLNENKGLLKHEWYTIRTSAASERISQSGRWPTS